LQAVSEEKYEKMVEEQLEKLRQEKESRARDGAPTPPSPGTQHSLIQLFFSPEDPDPL
jgi:hypothetical protein